MSTALSTPEEQGNSRTRPGSLGGRTAKTPWKIRRLLRRVYPRIFEQAVVAVKCQLIATNSRIVEKPTTENMALISAFVLIRTLSIFHLTLAYYFLVSPEKLSEQALVFMLGEALQLPTVRNFEYPTGPSAMLAMVLALLGLNDLVAVSLSEEVSRYYWGAQAPLRLLFFFCLPGYIYIARPGGPVYEAGSTAASLSGGDSLKNGLIFTWAFVEMLSWFWIYTTLRDEGKDAAIRIMSRRKRDDDDDL